MREKKDAPLRADAQRNRERILDVALAELTRSADAPLSVIARKAGVGQGTFYRNFPSREALVLEVYRHEMRQVAESAARLLAAREPDRALREWMDRLARFAMAKAGLQQFDVQVAGELADLLRGGGRGEVQGAGGRGDRAVVGDRPQDVQSAQVNHEAHASRWRAESQPGRVRTFRRTLAVSRRSTSTRRAGKRTGKPRGSEESP
ncbi:hypothetical protein SGRIM128S_08947 [Streptomyces griseomycini]